ncbi:unnamed protein product, partial [Cyprideis torosa]
MNDITHKVKTARQAIAIGAVFCNEESIEKIKSGNLPKGEPFQVCKSAAMLAAKQTANLIPHCHPVPIDALSVKHFLFDDPLLKDYTTHTQTGVYFVVEAKSIGRTGIEMEALTATSLACLTLYDLLKPLGKKDLSMGDIRLLEKRGGKSDKPNYPAKLRQAVIISNSAHDQGEEKINALFSDISALLEKNKISVLDQCIVHSDEELNASLDRFVSDEVPLILISGKTSTQSDWITDLEARMDRKLDGFVHAMYQYGLERNPLAANSNLTAGVVQKSLSFRSKRGAVCHFTKDISPLNGLAMISYQEALDLILAKALQWGEETLPLEQAIGRFLAQDLISDRDYPPFNRAAMDGFALRAEDKRSEYQIKESVFPGQAAQEKIGKGEAYRIMTGAAVPIAANCVIQKEVCQHRNIDRFQLEHGNAFFYIGQSHMLGRTYNYSTAYRQLLHNRQ